MTLLKDFTEKLDYLKHFSHLELTQGLMQEIDRLIAHHSELSFLRAGLRKALYLDLCYLYLRHQAWHKAPLFSELTIDFLNSEYQFPYAVACETVESCLVHLSPYQQDDSETWEAQALDREFLFELFIASAKAVDEASLRRDIGFGDNVIQVFRSAMQLAAPAQADVFAFAPEITHSIHEIMHELAQEAQQCPWIMDLYQLRVVLGQGQLRHAKRVSRSELNHLFDILLTIGGGQKSLSGLAQELNMQAEDGNPLPSLDRGLQVLLQHHLVFQQLDRRKPLYQLSATGLEIIADAYAYRYNTEPELDLKQLGPLPEILQTQIIKRHFKPSQTAVSHFGQSAHHLGPQAVHAIATQLAQSEYANQILEVLRKLLHNSDNYRTRASICRCLANEFQHPNCDPLLADVARNDRSPTVRKIARAAQQSHHSQPGRLNQGYPRE
jgi:hypothetical protein